MKRFITLIFCYLVVGTIFSQPTFVAGSVTKANGESRKGFIDYREWQINPRSIVFKDINGKINEYTCADLLDFKIDEKNEIYKKANISVNYETPPYLKRESEIDPVIKLTRDTVFLLTLAKGSLNLFSLRDEKMEDHFFIQKPGGKIEELINRKIFILTDNNSSGGSANGGASFNYALYWLTEYKKQLLAAMPSYRNIATEVSNLPFKQSEILNLVIKYNDSNEENHYVKPRDKGSSAFYAFAGVAQSSFNFAYLNPSEFFLSNYDFENLAVRISPKSNSPTFGVGMEWGVVRTNKRLFAGVEALYQQNKATFSNVTQGNLSNFTVNATGLRGNLNLKYILYRGTNIQCFARLGYHLTHYFTSDFYQTGAINKASDPARPLLKKESYVFGGLGIKTGNVFIESRFEPGTDINRTSGQDLKINRISLVAGYSFTFGQKK